MVFFLSFSRSLSITCSTFCCGYLGVRRRVYAVRTFLVSFGVLDEWCCCLVVYVCSAAALFSSLPHRLPITMPGYDAAAV